MMFPMAGLLVAIAEMALANGHRRQRSARPSLPDAIPFWFGEDQARYLIAAPFAEAEKIVAEARAALFRWPNWARPAATRSCSTTRSSVSHHALRDGHEGWFPASWRGEEIPLTN